MNTPNFRARIPLRRGALVVGALLLASCSKDTTAPTPPPDITTYRVELVSGSGQTDTVGAVLAQPLVVRVVASSGRPVAGQAVVFVPAPGSGSVSAQVVAAGADGLAQVQWTLGTTVGPAKVDASLGSSIDPGVSFVATVRLHPDAPLPPPAALHATAVASGYEHSCAISTTQELLCWGSNGAGQLGDGTRTNRNFASPVAGGMRVSRVAGGGGHTCAVTIAGELYCWGRNVWGQVGDGSTVTRLTPVRIAPALHFVDVAAGAEHTCALTTTGSVYCWGFMVSTQGTSYFTPADVSGGRQFASVYASSFGACGVGVDDNPYCFTGTYVADGPSGGPGNLWRPQPSPASGIRSFSGGLDFMCGVDGAAVARCWGSNGYGQLGVGTTDSVSGVATVVGARSYRAVYAGYDYACGITTDGPTYCWGHNNWGVVRPVVAQQYVEPTPVLRTAPAGVTFTSLAGGFYHMCGLGADTQVYCWGGGFSGQLGDNQPTADFYNRPEPQLVVRR